MLVRCTTRRVLGATLAGALSLVVFAGSGQASASHLSCGDTITADATLDSDLTNCPNNGLEIGADGITLNLNGHVIDGDGAPAAACDPEVDFCDVGVATFEHDGVTIRNGRTREFAIGVLAVVARRARVLAMRSTRNDEFGIVFGGMTRSVVRRSTLSRNIAPEGDGLGVFGSDHIRVVGNEIRRNPGPGIHIADSKDNLIAGNRMRRNSPSVLIDASRNEVRGNRIVGGSGILVNPPGDRNVIARNRVVHAIDSIGVEKGRGNLISSNVVVESRGAGIRLAIRSPSIGGAQNVVRGNRVRAAHGDAYLVNPKDGHSLLLGNLAAGARDDGFDILSATTGLARNRAVRNGDLGIEAGGGADDRGGNVARRNGDPRQCTGVVCS